MKISKRFVFKIVLCLFLGGPEALKAEQFLAGKRYPIKIPRTGFLSRSSLCRGEFYRMTCFQVWLGQPHRTYELKIKNSDIEWDSFRPRYRIIVEIQSSYDVGLAGLTDKFGRGIKTELTLSSVVGTLEEVHAQKIQHYEEDESGKTVHELSAEFDLSHGKDISITFKCLALKVCTVDESYVSLLNVEIDNDNS